VVAGADLRLAVGARVIAGTACVQRASACAFTTPAKGSRYSFTALSSRQVTLPAVGSSREPIGAALGAVDRNVGEPSMLRCCFPMGRALIRPAIRGIDS